MNENVFDFPTYFRAALTSHLLAQKAAYPFDSLEGLLHSDYYIITTGFIVTIKYGTQCSRNYSPVYSVNVRDRETYLVRCYACPPPRINEDKV